MFERKGWIGIWLPMLAVAAWAMPPAAEPLRVCLVSGSFEYSSDEALAVLKRHLESRYEAEAVLLKATGWDTLPGLEALDDCDVALFYTRRLTMDDAQLDRVRDYARSGRPLVAVRTANHGFQHYLEFDAEILGGNYHGNHGDGPTQSARAAEGAEAHPVLEGVGAIRSPYSLYKVGPLAGDCVPLLIGRNPIAGAEEPVAWAREVNGGRVVYTSLGGMSDFEGAAFQRLLVNALHWTAGRAPVAKPLPELRPRPPAEGVLRFPVRTRTETAPGSGEWVEGVEERAWPASETAIIVCDMWDRHWCPPASRRVAALALRVNALAAQARWAGALIVHAPSETLDFYADTPARRRAQAAPRAPRPERRDITDPPLPIDDSDGGCEEKVPQYGAWTRQHAAIEIHAVDALTDSGEEVRRIFAEHGIRRVLFTGVHTNMCVLNRSFGIRQLTRWGFECVLVRDLTDAMYAPDAAPFVSHDEGTELVVRHIERHWCPTALSDDVIAGLPEG